MDNKELPKEAIKQIGRVKTMHMPQYSMGYEMGCTFTHNHYAPIIEAKDKQLTEKDKRIAELEATHEFKTIGEQYSKIVNLNYQILLKDKKITELDATISKLMGLLKGKLVSSSLDDLIVRAKIKRIDINTAIDEYWADYCKENGIDLGGE